MAPHAQLLPLRLCDDVTLTPTPSAVSAYQLEHPRLDVALTLIFQEPHLLQQRVNLLALRFLCL